jgi:serine/threonine protein kinase
LIGRDLKPENLLLDEKGNIYITDFNLATSVEKRRPTSQSGTLDYMGEHAERSNILAPEMHIAKPYSYSIDWWAIGTILYECVYRKLPFGGGKNPEEVAENSRTHPLIFPTMSYSKTLITNIPERIDFITGLLQRDVENRLGHTNKGRGFEQEIKVHPYLAQIDWQLLEKRQLEPKFKPIVIIIAHIDSLD